MIDDTINYYFDLVYIIFQSKCIKKNFDYKNNNKVTLKKLYNIAVKNGYLEDNILTVIAQTPLNGKVFQYGNYGSNWVELGSIIGYA